MGDDGLLLQLKLLEGIALEDLLGDCDGKGVLAVDLGLSEGLDVATYAC